MMGATPSFLLIVSTQLIKPLIAKNEFYATNINAFLKCAINPKTSMLTRGLTAHGTPRYEVGGCWELQFSNLIPTS